jgi:PAS domain S-box-containing protein
MKHKPPAAWSWLTLVQALALVAILAVLLWHGFSQEESAAQRLMLLSASVAAIVAIAAAILRRRSMLQQGRLNTELHHLIDERSQIQQRLQGSQQQLQWLLDNLPDGVISFDQHHRVQWINPAARLMFQREAGDVVGRAVTQLIPSLDAATIQSAAGQRQPMAGRRADGSQLPLNVALVQTEAQGVRQGIALFHDTTAEQRVELMKSEFVSMVSHELRTPLTSLRASLGLLTDETTIALPSDAQYLLGMARDNAERLVHLVNDILDFERLRAGGLLLEFEPMELAAAAKDAIASVSSLAQQAQVTLRLDEPDPALPVVADARRLVQVISNLLSNAIKHSPAGSQVQVSLVRRDERVRLTVADSGPGVPADFAARLFEPFAQARDERKRKQGGTGLGLAISRGLMELMHGSVGLEPSPPGCGARFWIELPRRDIQPSTFGEL